MTLPFLPRIVATAVLAAAVSACSMTPTAPPKLTDIMSQASQAVASGNNEQAVSLWKQGAAAYPTDKAPWAHIAQTRYETGQYGDAIQAALEVLVRDPNDTLANSIIAISGLRLSTRALGDLSRQNNLSGSIKTESQDLAKLLRESLGETVLVPAPAPRTARTAPASAPAHRAARSATEEASNANPFQALK
jgi:hypothetical protein